MFGVMLGLIIRLLMADSVLSVFRLFAFASNPVNSHRICVYQVLYDRQDCYNVVGTHSQGGCYSSKTSSAIGPFMGL